MLCRLQSVITTVKRGYRQIPHTQFHWTGKCWKNIAPHRTCPDLFSCPHPLNNAAQWLFTQHWHGISYYKRSGDDLQNMESWTWGLRPVNSGNWRQKVASSRPIWAVIPRWQFSRILYSNCNKEGLSLCFQPHIWTVCVSHSVCSALGSVGTKRDEDKYWPHAESIPLHIRGSGI